MDRKAWLLSKFADKAAKVAEVAKSFSDRKAPYPKKVEAIKQKLLEEYKFWTTKSNRISSIKAKLDDVERDTNFVKSIQHRTDKLSNFEKERVDLLMNKYSVSVN